MHEKGVNRVDACKMISLMADGYTIAKLLDEYNYVRYTLRKSLDKQGIQMTSIIELLQGLVKYGFYI